MLLFFIFRLRCEKSIRLNIFLKDTKRPTDDTYSEQKNRTLSSFFVFIWVLFCTGLHIEREQAVAWLGMMRVYRTYRTHALICTGKPTFQQILLLLLNAQLTFSSVFFVFYAVTMLLEFQLDFDSYIDYTFRHFLYVALCGFFLLFFCILFFTFVS